MSNTRSKFESKFKERTKLVKNDNTVAQTAARQRQSRAAAVNNRRAVVTESIPLKEEPRITRGSNPMEDRKALLEKWKSEREARKQKGAEKNKKRGVGPTQVSSMAAAKAKVQPLADVKVSRPVGRPPKVKEDPRMIKEDLKKPMEQPQKEAPTQNHAISSSLQPRNLKSSINISKKQQVKPQAVMNNQAIEVGKKGTTSIVMRAAEKTVAEPMGLRKATSSRQVVTKAQETNLVAKKRGRPPLDMSRKTNEMTAVATHDAGKKIAKDIISVGSNKGRVEAKVDSKKVKPEPTKKRGRPPADKNRRAEETIDEEKVDNEIDEVVEALPRRRGRPSLDKSRRVEEPLDLSVRSGRGNPDTTCNNKVKMDAVEEVETTIKNRGLRLNKNRKSRVDLDSSLVSDVENEIKDEIKLSRKRGRPRLDKSRRAKEDALEVIMQSTESNPNVSYGQVEADLEEVEAPRRRGRSQLNKKSEEDADLRALEVSMQSVEDDPLVSYNKMETDVETPRKRGRPCLNKDRETEKVINRSINNSSKKVGNLNLSSGKRGIEVYELESDDEVDISMAKRFATPKRNAKSSLAERKSALKSLSSIKKVKSPTTRKPSTPSPSIGLSYSMNLSMMRQRTMTSTPAPGRVVSPTTSTKRANESEVDITLSPEIVIRKRGRPSNADRRKTIGGNVSKVHTPKNKGIVSIVATELRKRGRPPKLNRTPAVEAVKSPKDDQVEVEVQSLISTAAVLGSGGRKRGRPPKNGRRRTIAVGKVGTPKFFAMRGKRTRRSLQLTSTEARAKNIKANGDDDGVLIVSPIKNKKDVVETKDSIVISVSTRDENDEMDEVDHLEEELVPKKRAKWNSLGGDLGSDDHVLYSVVEEEESIQEVEIIEEDEKVEEVREGDKSAIESNEHDNNVLYSLVEEPEEEDESPESERISQPMPSTNLRKKTGPKKTLNMTAMEPLESTPKLPNGWFHSSLFLESSCSGGLEPCHAEKFKASDDVTSAPENNGLTFKTPLPRENTRKRYSMDVLKSDPKKCLKSFILKDLSPDERVEVLRHSPMIEMTRRKKSVLPKFQLDFDAEIQKSKFTDLMETERKRLQECCELWKNCLEEAGTTISEDVQGVIRVAVGKAELLMRERFNQFADLIEDHLTKRSEKPVTEEDLQGFWDMVLCQVTDVDASMERLKKLRENNWVEEVAQPVSHPKKKKDKTAIPPKAAPRGISKFAEFLKKKKELENQSMEQAEEDEQNKNDAMVAIDTPMKGKAIEGKKVFDGGFFHVESPIKPLSLESKRRSAVQGNKRRSLLTPARSLRTPFYMTDHSYAAKKRRESAAQRLTFSDFSSANELLSPPVGTSSRTRSSVINSGSSGKRRTVNFQNMEARRHDMSDSLEDTIGQYLRPSETSLLDTPLHRPRLSMATPGAGDGDLISFSPSTPVVKNAAASLRKSVLLRSSQRGSFMP